MAKTPYQRRAAKWRAETRDIEPAALSTAMAAKRAGIGESTLREAIQARLAAEAAGEPADDKGPKSFLFRRRRLIRPADLDAWLEALANLPVAEPKRQDEKVSA